MIKLDATHVFCPGLKKVYYSILFLTFLVLPYSLKAIDDERNLGAPSHISIKRKETIQFSQGEKFLEKVSETRFMPLYGSSLGSGRDDGVV